MFRALWIIAITLEAFPVRKSDKVDLIWMPQRGGYDRRNAGPDAINEFAIMVAEQRQNLVFKKMERAFFAGLNENKLGVINHG